MIVASIVATKLAILRLVNQAEMIGESGQALGITPDGNLHIGPRQGWPMHLHIDVWRQAMSEGSERFLFERLELTAHGRSVYVYQLTIDELKRWLQGGWRSKGAALPANLMSDRCKKLMETPVSIEDNPNVVRVLPDQCPGSALTILDLSRITEMGATCPECGNLVGVNKDTGRLLIHSIDHDYNVAQHRGEA